MGLISERHDDVVVFSTFFNTKLVTAGISGVVSWMNKVELFAKRRLWLIPVHLRTHWCLAVVDFKHWKICYYDSLRGNNEACFPLLKEYIMSFSQQCTVKEWCYSTPKNIPHQHNHFDCGIFVCMYAKLLAQRKKLEFLQKDMPDIRRHIAFELFMKMILN